MVALERREERKETRRDGGRWQLGDTETERQTERHRERECVKERQKEDKVGEWREGEIRMGEKGESGGNGERERDIRAER